MSEIALPWVRSKRKKRKPPRPQFWWMLAWVFWDLTFFGLDVMWAIQAGGPKAIFYMCFAAIMATNFVLSSYPGFRRELKIWLKDDEE